MVGNSKNVLERTEVNFQKTVTTENITDFGLTKHLHENAIIMVNSAVTLMSDSYEALNKRSARFCNLCLGVLMKLFNVSGCLKMVSETKGNLETACIFETLTLALVHGIAISVFVYFLKKYIMKVMQE